MHRQEDRDDLAYLSGDFDTVHCISLRRTHTIGFSGIMCLRMHSRKRVTFFRVPTRAGHRNRRSMHIRDWFSVNFRLL